MSIKVMSLVWEHSQHKGTELLLLLALADYAHDDGAGIYPSLATMAGKIRMSERNTRYTLRKLEEGGELVAVGTRASGTVEYAIPIQGLGWAGAKIAPRQNPVDRGARSAHEGGQALAPDPSSDPQQPPGVNKLAKYQRIMRQPRLGRR